MTPRKTILRELAGAADGRPTRPSEIKGFDDNAPGYRKAVNALLKDQLLTGAQDENGHLVVSLSPARMDEIRKEVRPWFAVPAVWVSLVAVLLIGAVALIG